MMPAHVGAVEAADWHEIARVGVPTVTVEGDRDAVLMKS